MAFCEQCGAELTPGVRFCEACGAKVDAEGFDTDLFGVAERLESPRESTRFFTSASEFEVFTGRDWKSEWRKAAEKCGGNELGLIVTREATLLEQLGGAGCDAQDFRKMLDDYIRAARRRGVDYHYLDLENFPSADGEGDVDSVVDALRKVVEVARPKYLMILGNEDIIDVIRWDNEARDDDEEVESDLCYSTLDVNSPWDGPEYDFSEVMRVGRIPSLEGEGVDSFARYFRNAQKSIGTMFRAAPYGLSAKVWENESNDEYRAISPRRVDVSPEETCETVRGRLSDDANLMFFNLHGSDSDEHWFGQAGNSYPEAFEPDILSGRQKPYFLGVEACYGARYLDGLDESESILQMAMRNRCLAFLGSSRIAYGTCQPKGSCADIVIGEYIKHLAKGRSAGDAYIEGLERLLDEPRPDDATVKTLAEFAFYGDPSARMGANHDVGIMNRAKMPMGAAKGLHVPMPDVRRAVRMALESVDAKLEAAVDEYAMRNLLPSFKGAGPVRQSVYKMSSGLNQKCYSWSAGNVKQVAKVYFDNQGAIHKVLVSK